MDVLFKKSAKELSFDFRKNPDVAVVLAAIVKFASVQAPTGMTKEEIFVKSGLPVAVVKNILEELVACEAVLVREKEVGSARVNKLFYEFADCEIKITIQLIPQTGE